MSKRVTGMDETTGRIKSGTVRKARETEIGTPRSNRTRDKIARALWH